MHVALVLLPGIGSTYEHTREGCFDGVRLGDAVVGMHGRLVTKAGHVAVACGIATQEVVGILQGVGTILGGAQHPVGKEERHCLTAAMLCQTAPPEVTRTVSVGRLEAGSLHSLDGLFAIDAEMDEQVGRQSLCILGTVVRTDVDLQISQPLIHAQRRYIAPRRDGETLWLILTSLVQIGSFACEAIQCRSRPEELVARIAVAIGARADSWIFELFLTIESRRMLLRPLVGTFSSLRCLSREVGIVLLVRRKETCCISHHRRKVERGSYTLRHHITRLVTIGRHHETLKVGGGQLVIDTTIVRILHGEQPLEIEHHLVQKVGGLVTTLRDVGLETGKVVGLLFVRRKHQSDTEGRIDHILVVVACIVPAIRRADNGASRPFLRRCRWMHQHMGVGMPQGTVVRPTLLDGDA